MQTTDLIASMHRAVTTAITCGRQVRDIMIMRVFCATLAALHVRTGQTFRVCYERGHVVIRCEATGDVIAMGTQLPPSARRFFKILALTPNVTTTFLETGVRVACYERQLCVYAPIVAIACAFA